MIVPLAVKSAYNCRLWSTLALFAYYFKGLRFVCSWFIVSAMEKWLHISFQVGHICKSVGETLLTVHEVLTYGSINGRTSLPPRGPNTQATDENGVARETGEGTQGGKFSQDREHPAQARGERGGHPGSPEAHPQTPQVITSTPTNGKADRPIADIVDLVVELEQGEINGNVEESTA